MVKPKLIIDVDVRTHAIRVRSWASQVRSRASCVLSGWPAMLVIEKLHIPLAPIEPRLAIRLAGARIKSQGTKASSSDTTKSSPG
jgi:hypothetical protein